MFAFPILKITNTSPQVNNKLRCFAPPFGNHKHFSTSELKVTCSRPEEEETLADRIIFSSVDIFTLLARCLKCTYFLFQGKYYLQIHGAAMRPPLSSIVRQLEYGGFRAQSTGHSQYPRARWWLRYADDTHTILNEVKSDRLF